MKVPVLDGVERHSPSNGMPQHLGGDLEYRIRRRQPQAIDRIVEERRELVDVLRVAREAREVLQDVLVACLEDARFGRPGSACAVWKK